MSTPEPTSETKKGEEGDWTEMEYQREDRNNEYLSREPEDISSRAGEKEVINESKEGQSGEMEYQAVSGELQQAIQQQEFNSNGLESKKEASLQVQQYENPSNQHVQSFHQLIEDLPEQGSSCLDNEDKKTEKSLVEHQYQQIPVQEFGDEELFSGEVSMKKKQEGENHQFYGIEREQTAQPITNEQEGFREGSNQHEAQPINEGIEEVQAQIITQRVTEETQTSSSLMKKESEGKVVITQTENQATTQETQTSKSLMKKESEGKVVVTQTENQTATQETQTSKSLLKKEEGKVVLTQTENETISNETQTSSSLMKKGELKSTMEEELMTSNQRQRNQKLIKTEEKPHQASRKFPSLFFQYVPGVVQSRLEEKEALPIESLSNKEHKEQQLKNSDNSKQIKLNNSGHVEAESELKTKTPTVIRSIPLQPQKEKSEKEQHQAVHKKKKKKHKHQHKPENSNTQNNLQPKQTHQQHEKNEHKPKQINQQLKRQREPSDPHAGKPAKKLEEKTSESIHQTSLLPQSQPELSALTEEDPPLVHSVSQQDQPPLTSQIIATEAYKERMGSTYYVFTKYVNNYTKALNYYKQVVQNVNSMIQKQKNSKIYLLNLFTQYFEGYAKANREFNEKVYSIQHRQLPASNNPLGNIKLQLRQGYTQLLNVQKTVANECLKMSTFTLNTIMSNIKTVFSVYFQKINLQQERQNDRRAQHAAREKTFYKVISQIQKVFRKGMEGKFKIDILSELARFVNEEMTHRGFLKSYGKGILPIRKIYKEAQNELFISLQQILNKFKTQSKVIYSVGRRFYDFIESLQVAVKSATKIEELSPLTDIDYIRYVLQIQQKKEPRQFKTHHFESFLELIYLDRLVGNIRDVYKGAVCKIFPMTVLHEELIHTISGNLVHFNRDTDQVLNIFKVKNINARIISEGTLQFDELLEGIIFNESRTVRVKLKDSDRAQQLICYLDEKENDFVVEERPVSLS